MTEKSHKNNHKTPQELLELFKKKDLPENFCIIPFVNLIFNPGGEVGVCRQKGTQHVVGNLTENSIEEIWNNEYIKKWREEFLSGNVKICAREIKEDFCHLGSSNYEYFDEVDLNIEQSLPMKKFTANFNGLCNLECKMCDVWKMPNGYYDKIEFWDKAKNDFFPFIKEIELLSGEPFIQKDTWRLIEAVSNVNPECLWSLTTNAHWKLNQQIKNNLDKIKIKNIHLSIDSLERETYAQIRIKGNLDIVLKNIDDLLKYQIERENRGLSSMGLALHFLVMQDNWNELANVIKFTADKNIRLILDLLKIPNEYSLLNLSSKEKIHILNNYLSKMELPLIKRSMQIILPLINSLDGVDKKSYLLKLGELNAN